MAKLIILTIGGQSSNHLAWRSLTPLQSLSFSSVSVCCPLLLVPFPLYHSWIHVSNKIVNQVNCNWRERTSRETRLLGVSACIELIKLWLNCPRLPEFQQFDFIERIYTPDKLPNAISSIFFDFYRSTSLCRPASVDAKRKEGTDIKFCQRRYFLA
jgi:hypothetical protein